MTHTTCTETDLWGWKGLRIECGRVSLTATPEVGGRIVSLTLDGEEVLFTLPELRGVKVDLKNMIDLRAEKRKLGWRHYGGYKTWLAPQENWTESLPFLDLDSGRYESSIERTSGGPSIQLTSPVCRESGIQFTRRISTSAGRIIIDQAMTNRSNQTASWGLWDVTQVGGPGLAVLPLATPSQFRGGVKAYPGEGRSPEVIDQYVERKDGVAKIRCREVEPFKFGSDSTEGWILGLLERGKDQWLAYLKSFKAVQGAVYPHQSVVEVYDSGTLPYFELEAHSPLQRLSPGQTYNYAESWILDWLPKTFDAKQIQKWIQNSRKSE